MLLLRVGGCKRTLRNHDSIDFSAEKTIRIFSEMKSGKKTGGHGALLTLSSLLPYGGGEGGKRVETKGNYNLLWIS